MGARDPGGESPPADPLAELERWIEQAGDAGVSEPGAACLATVDESGDPDARMVIVRGISGRGLTWFTDYGSAKACQLAGHPIAALVFHWEPLHRSVRLRGPVTRTTVAESDAYWDSRPRGSQLSARASRQSSPVGSRSELEAAVAAEDAAHPGAVPRPDSWGGFRLAPRTVELWVGRRDRLHDRWRYVADGGAWSVTRLQP